MPGLGRRARESGKKQPLFRRNEVKVGGGGDLREEEVWPGAPDRCLRCHRLLSQWTEKHLMWVLTLVLFLGLIPK